MAENTDASMACPIRGPETLYERFREVGIEFTAYQHEPVFTVEEAQRARAAAPDGMPGAHCKSLFLKDKKGALYLVVCLEDRRLDMKALAGVMGSARLSFGRPELLIETLGVEPGSGTPFAAINDAEGAVSVFLDAEMMKAPLVNYHPLVNTHTVAMTPADLVRFLESCDHAPPVVDLDPATAQ